MAKARHAHERQDVAPRVPVWIAAAMLATIAASIALVVLLMQSLWAPPAGQPDAFGNGERAAPQPALQSNPRADLAALQQQWDSQLQHYGWVDRSAGIAHIPIAAAMDHIAEQGLADREQKQLPPLLPAPVQPDREAL